MITAYTVLNDRLFGKMVHPIYEYGKDGYVFGSGVSYTADFGEYTLPLARMVGGSRAPTPAEALRLRVQRRQRCRHRFLARQLYMLRMVPHDRLFP